MLMTRKQGIPLLASSLVPSDMFDCLAMLNYQVRSGEITESDRYRAIYGDTEIQDASPNSTFKSLHVKALKAESDIFDSHGLLNEDEFMKEVDNYKNKLKL